MENIHLFQRGDWLFAMNGKIESLKDKTTNDTIQIMNMCFDFIKTGQVTNFLSMWEARFLLINRKTKEIFKTGTWHTKNDVNYSKDDIFFEKKITVFNGGSHKSTSTTTPTTTSKQNDEDVKFILADTEDFLYYSEEDNKWYIEDPSNVNPIFIPKIVFQSLGFKVKDIYLEEHLSSGYKSVLPYNEKYNRKNKICGFVKDYTNKISKYIEGDIYNISQYKLHKLENKLKEDARFYLDNIFVCDNTNTKLTTVILNK